MEYLGSRSLIFGNILIIAVTILSVHYVEALQEEIEFLEDELSRKEGELDSAEEQIEDYESRSDVEYKFNPEVEEELIGFPVHEDDFLRYTSPFGVREGLFFGAEVHHTGVDIATVWRAQAVAVEDGEVVEHWPPPGNHGGTEFRGHETYGGMILVDHGEFESMYAHLENTRVTTGQTVEQGQKLGRVGETGRTTGSHLHFELFVQGERVNPLLYMEKLEGRL